MPDSDPTIDITTTPEWQALIGLPVPGPLGELFAGDPGRAERYVIEVGDLRIDYSKQRRRRRRARRPPRRGRRGRASSAAATRCSPASTSTSPRIAPCCTSRCGRRPASVIEVDGDNVVARRARGARRDGRVRRPRSRRRADHRHRQHRHRRVRPRPGDGGQGARRLRPSAAHAVTSCPTSTAPTSPARSPASTRRRRCSSSHRRRSRRSRRSPTPAPRGAWLVDALGEDAVADHFVAVSTNAEQVAEFGIDTANMFGFWDWVGGRYSVDSAIGLSLMIAHRTGARSASSSPGSASSTSTSATARSRPTRRCSSAMIGVWHANVLGYATKAVLPYAEELGRFPAYLQQLDMESNGKSVRLDGSPVDDDDRPDRVGRAGHQRPARVLPTAAPGHPDRAGRLHRLRQPAPPVPRPPRPADGEPVRPGRGARLRARERRRAVPQLRGQPAEHDDPRRRGSRRRCSAS